MLDCERELFKLGIPAKTRHNEVAPGQFELAPVFERSNVAADHQQLLMVTLKRIAQKHGMECLFHEKPFEGINGSGKHVNFSLGNATEGNLLLPGDTPHDNAQFLVFCAAVIRSVHKYGGLLRASVASATNDHRLGANEAPPAIISIFLGDQLTDVFDQIAKGGATSSKEKGTLTIGADTLPVLPTDPGDRNRTSPFAFTGNRFEFRAPGSLQSIAGPMVTINTILAEALDYIATALESLIADGTEFNRGLPNLRTTLDAIPELVSESAMELFSRYGVFSHREMHSRYEVALEQYTKSVGVEAKLTLEIGTTVILPAAVRYQTELALNLGALQAVGVEFDATELESLSAAIGAMRSGLAELATGLTPDHEASPLAEAEHARDVLLVAMASVRSAADLLEGTVADDLWPLPTYQEMLFIL
jgi:glutamine synthetase